MKKYIIVLISIISMCFLSGCSLNGKSDSDIDFKGLTASQVKRVYIFSSENRYSDIRKLAELSDEDINTLVLHLNLVELSGEPTDQYKQVTEMYWEMYRVELTDGRKFDFSADNHFYVIDGKGYAARSDLGSEIFKQYHEWDEEYFPENYSD